MASDYQTRLTEYTLEELAPYEDKVVAFSRDGSRVLASGEDLAAVMQACERLGLTRGSYRLEYIPPFDASLIS